MAVPMKKPFRIIVQAVFFGRKIFLLRVVERYLLGVWFFFAQFRMGQFVYGEILAFVVVVPKITDI